VVHQNSDGLRILLVCIAIVGLKLKIANFSEIKFQRGILEMVSMDDWPRLADMPFLIASLAPAAGFVFVIISLYFSVDLDYCIEGDFARRNTKVGLVLASISTAVCSLVYS